MSGLTRYRSRLRALFNRSDLDAAIPPEIEGDAFAAAIRRVASGPSVRSALEIGASGGAGSTRQLVEGLRQHAEPTLVCLEVSKPRFAHLSSRYRGMPWVHCLNQSSIAQEDFPDESVVQHFLRTHDCEILYDNPEREVLRWLSQDRAYLREHNIPDRGIQRAREIAEVQVFDLVLIDGSEFTGMAELEELIGAKFVLLDDVRTFKNFANRQRLLDDPAYELIEEDLTLRNGYSVFATIT